MKIAVDLDDVVLDFMTGVRRAVETEYGVTIPEYEHWDMSERLDPIIGFSWWKWLRRRDWLWPNFPAIPGAIGGIDRLRQQGHYVECVTSKPDWAEFATWKWLGKWRPAFQRVTIVRSSDKKSAFTDAELLIDDKMSNCEDFAREHRTAYLFERPHNRSASIAGWAGERISRAHNWEDVLFMVEMEDADA